MGTSQCQRISTAAPLGDSISASMERFVLHVKSLYSLPAVAAEVLELTSSPGVDSAALKECIERDPALTVRILRVVNSSLFGLSHPVNNLNQAITLLGIKPLKLLVLGFSLPESLFANVAREQLEWYWSTTLVRAVAAREISEQLFDRPGDEAFLAGLLQDIGMLALIGQFRETYTRLLSRAMTNEADLELIETEALGFDHLALSAALLQQWNMPVQLGRAIANLRKREFHASDETPTDHLTRVLQLANLLGELVGHHRLSALPELLELGGAYCELDKNRLNEIVADLQPKVEQLAEVLSLQLPDAREYSDILVEAHVQLSSLVDVDYDSLNHSAASQELLSEASLLKFEARELLTDAPASESVEREKFDATPGRLESDCSNDFPVQQLTLDETFNQRLILALGRCRSQRKPLSVVMLEVSLPNQEGEQGDAILGKLLDAVCRGGFCSPFEMEACSPTRRILALPGCDREEAVRMAKGAIHAIEVSFERYSGRNKKSQIRVQVGVANVALPSKNFEASRLLQAAERCLAGASTCGISAVKSLEIY